MNLSLNLSEQDAKTLLDTIDDIKVERKGTTLWKDISDQLYKQVYKDKQALLQAGEIRELAEEMREGKITSGEFEDIVEAKLLKLTN